MTRPTRNEVNVRTWRITYAAGDGTVLHRDVYGKLVLDDRWCLVLDPDTKEVVFTVFGENLESAEPV